MRQEKEPSDDVPEFLHMALTTQAVVKEGVQSISATVKVPELCLELISSTNSVNCSMSLSHWLFWSRLPLTRYSTTCWNRDKQTDFDSQVNLGVKQDIHRTSLYLMGALSQSFTQSFCRKSRTSMWYCKAWRSEIRFFDRRSRTSFSLTNPESMLLCFLLSIFVTSILEQL